MDPSPTAGPLVMLTRLSRLVFRTAAEDNTGMRLKWMLVLSYLRTCGGPQQGDLCNAMHMDRNNCVLLLNELEEAGFVLRERDPEDRRRHIVRATPEGLEALHEAEDRLETHADEVLGALDDDERAALRALLDKALEAHRPGAAVSL